MVQRVISFDCNLKMEEHDYDGPPYDEPMDVYPNNVTQYYIGNLDYEGLGYLAELPTEVLLLIGSFVVVDENVFYNQFCQIINYKYKRICCTSKAFAQWFFTTVDSYTVKITKDYRADSLFRLLPFLARKYRRMCITVDNPGIMAELPSNLTTFECETLSLPYEKCLRYCRSLTDLTVVKYYHSFIDTLGYLKNLTYLYLYGFDAWYYDNNFLDNMAKLNVKTFKTVVPFYVKPSFVSNMTRVTDMQIYSIDAPNLAKLTNLEKLYQFRVDSKIFALTQLTSLAVGSPKFIKSKDKSLWDQLEVFTRLKELSVTCKRNIPLPLQTVFFPTSLQRLSLTNVGSIDVHELIKALSHCKNLRRVELEADISDEDYATLEHVLNHQRIEFVRVNTRFRYLIATKEDDSKDKYDFRFVPGQTSYLIEDHGDKYLLYKKGLIGFVDASKWIQLPNNHNSVKQQ